MIDNSEEHNEKQIIGAIGDKLYHYTSFLALKGILQNKELWFGSLYNMNDKEEVTAYITKLKEISKFPYINDKKLKSLYGEVELKLRYFYPFALSFSGNKDDAAMWERYAQNAEGVCIVFNTRKLIQIFQEKYKRNYVFCKEFYDIEPEGEMLTRVRNYCEGKIEMSEEMMANSILIRACSYKHESFRAENEFRIYTTSNLKVDRTTSYGFIEEPNKIKRILKAHILRICESQKDDASEIMNELIEQIVIGPRSSTTKNDLREYILDIAKTDKDNNKQDYGLEALSGKISKSECPLR